MLNILVKVTGQDILIICIYLLVACFLEKSGTILGNTTSFIILISTWPVLLLAFFYSNAELFKKVKNEYLWSLSSAVPSIILTTGTIIYATHNTCKVPFYE